MTQLLFCFCVQIIPTIGTTILLGFLVALCNRSFYSNVGSLNRGICFITGFIGTPVHELAHALFCVIFGHKIVEIKLYQPNSEDGVLGYVNHSYNPKNLYHRIGNFFIGVAPIVVISALLYLLARFMIPDLMQIVSIYLNDLDPLKGIDSVIFGFRGLLAAAIGFFKDPMWWLFIVLGSSLSLHMTLSGADIKGAISGIAFLLVSVFAVDVILYFFSIETMFAVTRFVMKISGFYNLFLLMGLLTSAFVLLISVMVKVAIKKKLRR